MSFVEKRDIFRPPTGEAPFKIDETFYSRTDERGVIKSGNYVFRRVADYNWDEMIGAPHKIIRHPDMPKAVFWLLWDTIKRGEAIGAYVKNLAKDGLYYWVFAVVVPCPGGFLSARMKPTSALRGVIEREYAVLLKAEKEEGLTPQDSAARLMERIRDLGFADYPQFAAHALSEELLARDAGTGQDPDPQITGFRRMLEAAGKLESETSSLVDDFYATRTIPTNMRVIASRLEPTGGPVSTLSKNYGQMSQEISDWFETNVVGPDSNFATIKATIANSLFVSGMSRILKQCADQLAGERRRLGDVNLQDERGLLNGLVDDYGRKSGSALEQVALEAERIGTACDKMRRLVLGLSTTRVMCKIESARLSEGGESLSDIINQLNIFQDRIKSRLEEIARYSNSIRATIG